MLNRIANNWNLKLMALVLAVVLWSHVRSEVNPLETATFKVRLPHEPPPRMILVNEDKLPTTVEVTVRAPRQTLREIKGNAISNPLGAVDPTPSVTGEQIKVQLDYSKVRLGEQETQTVPIQAIIHVADAEVIGKNPSDVDVVLDQATSMRLPVDLPFPSAAVAGYRVENTHMAPESVELFGPSNALNRVAGVRARIELQQLSPGVEKTLQVPVIAVDEDGRTVSGVNLEPPTVQVTGTLLENRITRRIRILARWKGSPATGYRVMETEITPSRLSVRGPQRLLEKVSSLYASINVDGAKTTVSRRAEVVLPPGVTTAEGSRVLVKVHIAPAQPRDRMPAGDDRDGQSPVTDGQNPDTMGQPASPSNEGGSGLPEKGQEPGPMVPEQNLPVRREAGPLPDQGP